MNEDYIARLYLCGEEQLVVYCPHARCHGTQHLPPKLLWHLSGDANTHTRVSDSVLCVCPIMFFSTVIRQIHYHLTHAKPVLLSASSTSPANSSPRIAGRLT